MHSIHLNILFFGACREAVNFAELQQSFPAPLTVADVWATLTAHHPVLQRFATNILFAVNEAHALPQQHLADGDVLAIFPPVSGG